MIMDYLVRTMVPVRSVAAFGVVAVSVALIL